MAKSGFLFFGNQTNITRGLSTDDTLSDVSSLILGTYFTILLLAGTTLNSLLMCIIYSHDILHKSCNILIINLLVCDILTSLNLFFDSSFLLRLEQYDHSYSLCALKETGFLFTLSLSVLSMLLVTMEKLIIFNFPFRYTELLTSRRITFLLVVSWTYSIFVACYPLLEDSRAVKVSVDNQGNRECYIVYSMTFQWYVVLVNCLLPILLILLTNCLVFRIATRSMRSLPSHSSAGGRSKLINWRAARTTMAVTSNESLCWLVFILTAISNTWCGQCHSREVTWLVYALNSTSVVTNPLIYSLLNRQIRKIIVKVYCRFVDGTLVEKMRGAMRECVNVVIISIIGILRGENERREGDDSEVITSVVSTVNC